MTTVFRINGFHNCNGCSRKVRKALTRFHGVQLINLDRENGNVTVFIAEHPAEVIRDALEQKMKKTVVIVSMNQNHNSSVSSILPAAQRALDLQGFGEALVGMIHVLDSVEITRSNTLIVKFNHRENTPVVIGANPRGNKSYGGVCIEEADVEYTPRRPAPPLPVAEPSAPPLPVAEPLAPLKAREEEEVYGYPPEYYGFSGSHDHPDEWCRIV